jgi:UDP-glucose-4-epimerase GalE
MSHSSQKRLRQSEFDRGAVLVVGGAGYVGSHIAKALMQAGYTPVTFDNLSSGRREFVKFGPFERGDLRDIEKLALIFQRYKPVAVAHCATSRLSIEGRNEPNELYQNIVLGTLSLLDVMRGNSVNNLCMLTNAAIYGSKSGLEIPEQTGTEPLTPYGACLTAIENIAADFGLSSGLRWISLRLFSVGGADVEAGLGEDHAAEIGLIPLAIDAALRKRDYVPILGSHFATRDGTALRDFLHVSDAADAAVLAIEHLFKNDGLGPYNIGTGKDHSVTEIIRMVESVSGLKCPVRFEAKLANEPFALSSDSERARWELGWSPRSSTLEKIVQTAFQFRKDLWERRLQDGIPGVARHQSDARIHHEPLTDMQIVQTEHEVLLKKLDEFLAR